jgi:hypothetical protein
MRPFLSGPYRKKLILEFSGQFYHVPLHPGKRLRKAPAIELNFLRPRHAPEPLSADRSVGDDAYRRSVHHTHRALSEGQMFVGLVCYPFQGVRTRTSECSMTGRFADAYSEPVQFFCSNPVNSPMTMKVHSSHTCSRRSRNLQYERRMRTPRKSTATIRHNFSFCRTNRRSNP